MAPRPLWTRPSPRLRNFTPSTRHGRRPEYTSRRGAPGALQSGRATRRARNCASRGRSAWCRRRRWRMPRRRSQLLFLSGVLFVASLAGSRLVGGRHCRWTRPPGGGRHPNYRRGGRYFIYRPPQWYEPSDPPLTAGIKEGISNTNDPEARALPRPHAIPPRALLLRPRGCPWLSC